MSAAERLDEIEARYKVADDMYHKGCDRGDEARAYMERCEESADDVPALVAALRAVHKPEIAEDPEWLQGMRTLNTGDFGGDPGNAEYMEYLRRVLTAAVGHDDFRWGPIILAIVLDRHIRATEDAAAIAAALDGAS